MSTIPQRLGRYELRQRLGRGNVGEVWKGFDMQLRREVALKIIHSDLQADSSFLARFMQEGQTIASLHHANIAQVHDVSFARPTEGNNTTAYIVTEYIEGETLADYINRTSHKGDFPPVAEIVYLFTSLGVAIDYAHQKGIVHGDIKPSNILLDRRNKIQFLAGEPTLTDFALARLIGNSTSVGTPLYMSPEQAKGYPANNRSDIYSLGVILYEMCTGVQPFRDDSSVAVLMQHINTLPTPPSLINHNIPPALSEVILRAMAKETAPRFSMASLLAAAIADACSMQSSITIVQERSTPDDEPTTSTSPHTSILGVSQPMPKIMPFPPGQTTPRLPQVSQHLPAVSPPAANSKSTLKIPAIHATAQPTPHAPMELPNVTTPIQAIQKHQAQTPVPSVPSGPLVPISALSPSTALAPLPPAPSTVRRKNLWRANDVPMYILIGSLFLVLLVIGSAIIASLVINNKGNGDANGVVGHIFFQDDALGHADQLRIDMQHIADPAQGKVYTAWLNDIHNHSTRLGTLSPQNGTISYLYPGDAQHTNLVSIIQSVLITQENSGTNTPSPQGNTVFKATIDAAAFPYIRNILYQMSGFPMPNGIAVGMFETIKAMNDKTGSIGDSIYRTLDYGLVERQATRVIEMIDGHDYARSSGDLPARYVSFIDSRAGIISSPTQIGYLDTLQAQLQKIQLLPGSNSALLQHVQNALNAVTDLKNWIQQVRTYDVQLLKAPALSDPALINVALQLKQITSDAYTGRVIPPAANPQNTVGSAGALQAYTECQYMASLDVQAA